MLCEFNLPSNPAVSVRLREATVADAIDFSEIDPDREEHATTIFLNTVQEKETYTDSLQWTGEDRRYALWEYYIATNKFKATPVTYTCSRCGKEHTKDIEHAKIDADYTPISGKSFREFPFNGHNLIVYPLNGEDMEGIENVRTMLLFHVRDLEDKQDSFTQEQLAEKKAKIRSLQITMGMLQVICHIDLPFLDDNGTRKSRHALVEKFLKELPATEFRDLMERVQGALEEMRHGLRSTLVDGQLMLEIPDVRCDEHPEEEGITLRYPFRFSAVIPTL